MDKVIHELLLEMQKENREMKDTISTIVNTQEIMHQRLEELNNQQAELKQEMNQRFDSVEGRLEAVENKLDNLGEMFERNVKQDVVSKLEFEDLAKRVEKIESVLFRLTQN